MEIKETAHKDRHRARLNTSPARSVSTSPFKGETQRV